MTDICYIILRPCTLTLFQSNPTHKLQKHKQNIIDVNIISS